MGGAEGQRKERRKEEEIGRGRRGGKSEHDAIKRHATALFKRVRNVITLLETGCGQHRHNSMNTMSYIGGYTSVSSYS